MNSLNTVLESLPIVFTGGAGVGAGLYFLRWLFDWIGVRVDKREAAVAATAAQVDKATQALLQNMQAQISSLTERIGQMTTRIDTVESELEECRSKHAEAQEEIARLRGGSLGLGDARQQAQRIVSEARVVDRIADRIKGVDTQ